MGEKSETNTARNSVHIVAEQWPSKLGGKRVRQTQENDYNT